MSPLDERERSLSHQIRQHLDGVCSTIRGWDDLHPVDHTRLASLVRVLMCVVCVRVIVLGNSKL